MAFAKAVELLFIGCAALGVYGFVTAAKDGETRRSCTSLCALRPDYAARNRLAPDFELPSMNGGKVRLSSFRGKVVILNFWTKTCRPCLEEMPSVSDLGKALKVLKDGGDIDYVGGSAVEFIGKGESAGSYAEIVVEDGGGPYR